MYMIYWHDGHGPHAKEFGSDKLPAALEHSEAMRKQGMRFVSMAVEDPNHVGKMGVDVTGPDYDWRKRRP